MITRATLFAATLASATAHAADPGCRTNPHLVGACYRLHGTLMMSADVLWVMAIPGDPHRELVVRPAPGSNNWLPKALARYGREIPPNTLTADFLVCPIPEQQTQFEPGYLKFICVDAGSNIVVNKFKPPVRHQ
jgi:hypothetical protein